jgi:hypothetical protein
VISFSGSHAACAHTRVWPPRISSSASNWRSTSNVGSSHAVSTTPRDAGRPRPIHRVARPPHGRPTGDARAMAPAGLSAVLAVEVSDANSRRRCKMSVETARRTTRLGAASSGPEATFEKVRRRLRRIAQRTDVGIQCRKTSRSCDKRIRVMFRSLSPGHAAPRFALRSLESPDHRLTLLFMMN